MYMYNVCKVNGNFNCQIYLLLKSDKNVGKSFKKVCVGGGITKTSPKQIAENIDKNIGISDINIVEKKGQKIKIKRVLILSLHG